MPEALSSLRSPAWLKPDDLRIFCLRTFQDCLRMTRAGRFLPSSPRLMTWGTAWNGWCLTARISVSPRSESGCSLSDILIPDAPEKYFLSSEQTEKLLYKSSAGRRGSRVYDPRGPPVHRLPEVEERSKDRAVSDGAGHSTILFVDLCIGRPTPTENARCLTARYSQTTLCNHRGERSGVLLIKEATKRGYKEAAIGDTVDLGYAGSNTRRGRVGHDIAHTLETAASRESWSAAGASAA
mgnify:CR=1 FL=1